MHVCWYMIKHERGAGCQQLRGATNMSSVSLMCTCIRWHAPSLLFFASPHLASKSSCQPIILSSSSSSQQLVKAGLLALVTVSNCIQVIGRASVCAEGRTCPGCASMVYVCVSLCCMRGHGGIACACMRVCLLYHCWRMYGRSTCMPQQHVPHHASNKHPQMHTTPHTVHDMPLAIITATHTQEQTHTHTDIDAETDTHVCNEPYTADSHSHSSSALTRQSRTQMTHHKHTTHETARCAWSGNVMKEDHVQSR